MHMLNSGKLSYVFESSILFVTEIYLPEIKTYFFILWDKRREKKKKTAKSLWDFQLSAANVMSIITVTD